jgi:hypothetical protein
MADIIIIGVGSVAGLFLLGLLLVCIMEPDDREWW